MLSCVSPSVKGGRAESGLFEYTERKAHMKMKIEKGISLEQWADLTENKYPRVLRGDDFLTYRK